MSSAAPKPNGSYSHVIHAGGLLHVCGWMGDVPETGEIIEGGVEAQTVHYANYCQVLRALRH